MSAFPIKKGLALYENVAMYMMCCMVLVYRINQICSIVLLLARSLSACNRLSWRGVLVELVVTCIQGRVATLQALSGTGSLKVGAVFIQKFLPSTKVYLSNPTWGNHRYTTKSLHGPSISIKICRSGHPHVRSRAVISSDRPLFLWLAYHLKF